MITKRNRGLLSFQQVGFSYFHFYKLRLIALSFCIFLGGCSGDLSSDSSRSNSSSPEKKDCKVENGQGELTWNPTLGAGNDKCELIACNAGYDDHDDDNDCEETPEGHYSEAGSKQRIACIKPDDSSWTSGIGLAAVDECTWACDAGHDNSQNANVCAETAVGFYSPSATNGRTACAKSDDSSWTSGTTGLSSVGECASLTWVCDAGHDNSQNANVCAETAVGFYSPSATNGRTACVKSDDSSWTSGTTGLSSVGECASLTWVCDAGHDNSQNANVCAETAVGFYSPSATNGRTACAKSDDSSWTSGTTGLSSVGECASLTWVCDAGHDNSQNANVCAETAVGFYSPSATNGRIACTDTALPDDSSWAWAGKTGLALFRECWSCNANYYQSRNRNTCVKENIAISAGSSHTCAILADKSVKCWGINSDGQTGGGSPLTQGEEATHLSTGSSHTCAILADKSVKCWGSNSFGKTGGGSPLTQGEEATHIAAGEEHTCAILVDKSVKCWGSNSDGQTGGGSPLTQGEEATHIAAGEEHTCAILVDKSVKCWGSNSDGQTGGGSPLTQGEEATHIAAGEEHTCAILADKSVKCWGKNSFGQTGGGPSSPSRTISGTSGSPLTQGEEATHIAAGDYQTCAILANKSVKCWGSNSHGQTGGGNPLTQGEEATHIAAGSSHSCAILADKSVKCWGNYLGIANISLSENQEGQKTTHIAAGYSHTCTILADKSVKCWGSNSSGKTGGGSPLTQGEEATHIAAGSDPHLCHFSR